MSRVGKKPITLAKGVKASVNAGLVKLEGPKGTMTYQCRPELKVKVDGDKLEVSLVNEKDLSKPQIKSDFGTARATLNSMALGVATAWKKALILEGVGYNAKLAGDKITMSVGYSHEVVMTLPKGVTCKIDKGVNIELESADRQVLGNFAADIRRTCPPEPYLGKGIRYADEKIRRKAGKAGAGAKG